MAKKSAPTTEGISSVEVVETPAQLPVQVNSVPRYGRLIPREDTPLSQCPTSLNLSTARGKALAIAAGNPGDIDFDDKGTCRFRASDWIVFPDQGADPESGLVSSFSRVVYFDRDGRTFRTTSAHAPHRLASLCELYSREEWAAGIPMIVRERMSRKTKRTYHDIRVDVDALPEDGAVE